MPASRSASQPQDYTLGRVAAGHRCQSAPAPSTARMRPIRTCARRRRQDHQYRLDDVDLRRAVRRRLWREQGRHRADDKGARQRLGQGQHPGRTRSCRAGSIPTSRAPRAQQVPGLNERVLARTPAGRWGSPGRLRRALPCSSPAPRPTSSPAPRSRSTAAIPRRSDRGCPEPDPTGGCEAGQVGLEPLRPQLVNAEGLPFSRFELAGAAVSPPLSGESAGSHGGDQ